MFKLDVGSDGNDWSGIFVYRLTNGKRHAELLVIDYTKYNQTSKRIPGGCCAKDEHPADALGNEITQETDLELIDPEKVFHVWTNKKVPGKHHQHFFATSEDNVQGDLRAVDMKDDDELLGPPHWIPLAVAASNLFYSHRQGLERAIKVIADNDEDFHYAVQADPSLRQFLR